jgi:hypothetical protein
VASGTSSVLLARDAAAEKWAEGQAARALQLRGAQAEVAETESKAALNVVKVRAASGQAVTDG